MSSVNNDIAIYKQCFKTVVCVKCFGLRINIEKENPRRMRYPGILRGLKFMRKTIAVLLEKK